MHDKHFFPKKFIIVKLKLYVGDEAVPIPSSNCPVQDPGLGILNDWHGKMAL